MTWPVVPRLPGTEGKGPLKSSGLPRELAPWSLRLGPAFLLPLLLGLNDNDESSTFFKRIRAA